MTIVRCPRCRDEVTAPAQASPKALVRCPLCLEEYLLSEALAGVPPALIVVGSDLHDAEHAAASGDEYQLTGGGFAGVFDSRPASDAAVAPARPTVTAAPRPRKQEKNAVVELVKVVLGGIAGLAIGLVVLWWGFRRDPLDLGPEVAAYAPWLVPVQFHGKSKATDSDSEAAMAPNAMAPKKLPPKKSAAAERVKTDDEAPLARLEPDIDKVPPSAEPAGFDSGLLDPLPSGKSGKLPVPSLDLPLDLPKPAAANLDLPLELPPAKTVPNDTTTSEPPQGQAAEAAIAPVPMRPAMPDLTDLLPDDAPPAELHPGDARPVPSSATFAQAVAAASEALAKYEGLPKEDADARRNAFTKFFQATGEVGRVISYLNPMDAELSADIARLQDLLDTTSGAKGSSKLSPIKFLASQQWPAAKQDDGLLIGGTVKAVHPAGRLFEVTLDASSRSEFLLPVLMTTNPDELCAVGDNLVIVGRVLDEPQKHLPGYEGEHSRVLLLGHAVRAPKVE